MLSRELPEGWGTARRVSCQGLQLETSRALETERLLRLEIYLDERKPLLACARVCWSRPWQDGHLSGLLFERFGVEGRARLS